MALQAPVMAGPSGSKADVSAQGSKWTARSAGPAGLPASLPLGKSGGQVQNIWAPGPHDVALRGRAFEVGKLNPLAQEWRPPPQRPVLNSMMMPGFANFMMPACPMEAAPSGNLTPEQLLGTWADSLGNSVIVASVDAYELRLTATLSQPPRRDIHLALKPVPGGGWACGNSMLDPMWSSAEQLHWLTGDGRVSVWVRINEKPEIKPTPPDKKATQ